MNVSSDDITLADVPYDPATRSRHEDATRAPSPNNGPGKTKELLSESDFMDQTVYLPTPRVRIIVATLALAFFLAVLEQTILATALPSIASTFKAGKISSWVITSFLLGSTASSPFFGRFADIFGRKPLLLTCTAIFFGSTLLCAFSQSILQLIIFRAIQGVGTTGVSIVSMIVITDVVPLTERGKYQGIVEALVFCAQATGPLLSGVLVEKLSWRACFWTMLPIIGIAGVLQWFFVPSKATSGDWKAKLRAIDYLGCALILAGTVMILVAISRGGVEVAWMDPESLVLMVLGGFTCLLFVLWEAYGAAMPMLPLRLFKHRTVIGALVSTLTSLAANFIIMFYVPEFLQIVRGLSAIVSGAVILPYGALISIFVYVSVTTAKRMGTRSPIIAGHAVWAAGAGVMTIFDDQTHLAAICGVLAFGAVGAGSCVVTTMMTLEAAVPRGDRAIATAIRNFSRLLGASIGVAVAGSTISNRLSVRLEEMALPEGITDMILNDPASIQHDLREVFEPEVIEDIVRAYTQAFRLLFWIVTGLLLFAFVTAVLLIQYQTLERDDYEEQKAAAIIWLREEKAKKANADTEKGDTATTNV